MCVVLWLTEDMSRRIYILSLLLIHPPEDLMKQVGIISKLPCVGSIVSM